MNIDCVKRLQNLCTISIIASLTFILLTACICDTSDADAASTSYGSDDVGACRIVFDAAGGTGGYSQYVLADSENCFYFPTEKTVTRDGYVLLGWASSNGGSAVHYPGEKCTDTRTAI